MSRKSEKSRLKQGEVIAAADKIMGFVEGVCRVFIAAPAAIDCLWAVVEGKTQDGGMGVGLSHDRLDALKDELRSRGVKVFDSEEAFYRDGREGEDGQAVAGG